MNEKSLEQKIAELDVRIRIAINDSKLNVSIVELILRNIHNEIKQLADKNLEAKLKEQEEQNNGNTDEEG